jgi:cellulose biosynthesis protein BcsQ
MTTVLTFTNAKGGSAATTSAVTCGHWLATYGRPTLLIDTDRQSDCAKLLNLPCGDQVVRYLRRKIDADEAIVPTGRDGLHLMPSNGDVSIYESMLQQELRMDADAILDVAGRLRKAGSDYKYLLLDTGKKGELQEAAIRATDILIIPTMLDYASAANTVSMVELARQLLATHAEIVILPIGLDGRRRIAQDEVVRHIRKATEQDVGHTLRVVDGIPTCAAIQNAGIVGKTIWEHDKSSEAGRAYHEFMEFMTGGDHA